MERLEGGGNKTVLTGRERTIKNIYLQKYIYFIFWWEDGEIK
jgi:hypothetical protein